MELINLSAEHIGKLHSWIPHGLKAEKIVFLPDACPGKSPLPTGTVVQTRQEDWRKFAISDCGCGMRLLRSDIYIDDFTRKEWDNVANSIRKQKNKLGDLGGGNHFLDALLPYSTSRMYFLIHTGSRAESGIVDHLVNDPVKFDLEFEKVVSWAFQNRSAIQSNLEKEFGKLEMILDLPHNTVELLEDESVIIRKGAVKFKPDDICIIPSHMSGDVVLVRGTGNVKNILYSMSHGTGRKMSRSECKPLADNFDFKKLKDKIILADGIEDASLRTEGPFAYRDLEECLSLLNGYVEEVERFSVVAYMGHL
jgi:RNA-splicing ligase RtcB